MRRYETVFISLADLSSEDFDGMIERYTSIIEDFGGRIIKVDNWGKRKLAYQIEKKREGNYCVLNLIGGDEVVPEVERNFRFDDNILRYQTVKLSDKVDLEEIEREIAAGIKKEEAVSVSAPATENTAEPINEELEKSKASPEWPENETSQVETEEEKAGEEQK